MWGSDPSSFDVGDVEEAALRGFLSRVISRGKLGIVTRGGCRTRKSVEIKRYSEEDFLKQLNARKVVSEVQE